MSRSPFADLFKYFRKLEGEDPSTDKSVASSPRPQRQTPSTPAPVVANRIPSENRSEPACEKGVIVRYVSSTGYGFIVVTEGANAEKSVFLHASRIPPQFAERLAPGHEIHFSMAPGKKGPVCADVFWLSDRPMPVSPKLVAANKNFAMQNVVDKGEPIHIVKKAVGTVKFYNSAKQFGFIAVESGASGDIFLPRPVFEKLGVPAYNAAGTKVEIEYLSGKKGLEAVSATILMEPSLANEAMAGAEQVSPSPRM